MFTKEVELTRFMGRKKPFQHQPPEQLGEHENGQEEVGLARNPANSIERETAARHDHVDVWMMRHRAGGASSTRRRAPGVQDGRDGDPRAHVLRVCSDPDRGLGRDLEQQIVNHGLVLISDISDWPG